MVLEQLDIHIQKNEVGPLTLHDIEKLTEKLGGGGQKPKLRAKNY